MSQRETCAGGRGGQTVPRGGPGSGFTAGLGAFYLEQQGLKRFAGAKSGPR